MSSTSAYWKQVLSGGLAVPTDRPLDDLTAELTRMLGSADPAERDGTAYPTLATWVARGVYDDLLGALGDGMAAGLRVGTGRPVGPVGPVGPEDADDDGVFRRSFSALVLAECVRRDTEQALLPATKVLEWGDAVATWFLRETDLRGHVPGKGWAHALAHGADALAALAGSPHLAAPELTVLLDVVADRLLDRRGSLLVAGEPDRMALATMAVLRRDLVPLSVLEPWVARLAAAAAHPPHDDRDPFLATGDPEAYLRALHLQLALAPRPPAVRADLLLVLVDALRSSNPHTLG